VNMGKKKDLNNCCCGLVFLTVAIIFLILTIAVPVALISDPEGDPCNPAKTLRPGEQMYCAPENLNDKWIGEYESAGNGFVDIYKISKPKFSVPAHRQGLALSGSVSMFKKYTYFNFSVTHSGSLAINVACDPDSSSVTNLKLYLLKSSEFANARNSLGTFFEDKATPKYADACHDSTVLPLQMTGSDYYYLVFSCMSSVNFTYDITPSYDVVDLSLYSEKKCGSNKCTYEKMNKEEYIFIDYPKSTSGPKIVEASIHNNNINWSAVLIGFVLSLLIFGIISLICFIIAAVFLVKYLKKIGKLGKKALQKAEESS